MDFRNQALKVLFDIAPRQITEIEIDSKETKTLIYEQAYPDQYEYKDRKNILVNLNFLEKFCGASFVPELKYEKEVFDCDDYSYVMKAMFALLRQGHLVGMCKVDRKPNEQSGMHQINIFIGEDKVVYLLEPQTGEYFLPPEDWRIHAIEI